MPRMGRSSRRTTVRQSSARRRNIRSAQLSRVGRRDGTRRKKIAG